MKVIQVKYIINSDGSAGLKVWTMTSRTKYYHRNYEMTIETQVRRVSQDYALRLKWGWILDTNITLGQLSNNIYVAIYTIF